MIDSIGNTIQKAKVHFALLILLFMLPGCQTLDSLTSGGFGRGADPVTSSSSRPASEAPIQVSRAQTEETAPSTQIDNPFGVSPSNDMMLPPWSPQSTATVEEPQQELTIARREPAQERPSASSLTERLSSLFSQTLVGKAAQDNVARIGFLVPLSGRHASLGQSLLQAGQLATAELAPQSFELVPIDTGDTPEGARQAAYQALDKNVDMILGPLFSNQAQTVASVVRSSNVEVLAFTNDRAAAGRGIFIMGHSPEPQIAYILSYAKDQGLTKFAALVPDNAYGQIAADTLKQVIQYYGLELVNVVSYNPKGDLQKPVRELALYNERKKNLDTEKNRVDAELRTLAEGSPEHNELKKTREQLELLDTYGEFPYEAVLLVDSGDTLRTLVPMLAYFDIDQKTVRRLGIGDWQDLRPWQDPSFRGAWVAAPDPAYRENFEKRYRDVFGATPPRVATLAYDGVALATVLAKQKSLSFRREDITQPNGFVGVDGIFRFKPNYTVERGLSILEVTPRGMKPLIPAPTTFKVAETY